MASLIAWANRNRWLAVLLAASWLTLELGNLRGSLVAMDEVPASIEQAKREVYPRAWAAGFRSADETIDARGGMSVLRYTRAVEWRERQ
jgi:hypothetical protein